MADLRVKGEYVGPGEQRTAEHLAANLPSDWVIFAGRKLPGPNRDDADLIIVGKQLIFVVEEKAWGPTVVVDDNHWYVKNAPRPNPLNRVGQVARIVASTLKDHARGFGGLGNGHRVLAAVVMSHPKLQLLSGRNHDVRERIWTLEESVSKFISLDKSFKGDPLGKARSAIIAYLDDLPQPSGRPTLGGYTIESRLPGAGLEQTWSASDSTGESVILKCYPTDVLADRGDPKVFLRREYAAVNKVADLARTWRAHPPFLNDAGDLYVVPVVPPRGGTTFNVPVNSRPDDPMLDDQTIRTTVIDAFRALEDLHGAGLLHRSLHPRRVWIHQKRRVMFSDLNLARIEGETSIALWADVDMSEDYRAPECALGIELSTRLSDVFSLTLCVSRWLLDLDVTDMTVADIKDSLVSKYPWTTALLDGLAAEPEDRPEATQMAARLEPQPVVVPVTETAIGVFEPGGLVADRYEIDRSLGTGGFATSWKVYDRQRQIPVVLKQFKGELPANARSEFTAANELSHDRCGRVYDIQADTLPHYLVSQYVEGESLAAEGRAFSAEELRAIAIDVLTALDYIHGRDLVHGDVTPSNVIASPSGTGATLIDFGLTVREGAKAAGLTRNYAAPEVLNGRPATTASDLFGFAATMAYAMIGRTTRSPGPVFELDAPTDAEESAWDAHGSKLLAAFYSAAALDPKNRPDSAKALLELIRSTDDPEPPPGPPVEPAPDFQINPNVAAIRRLYRASAAGNAGNRGLDDPFAEATYVPTRLDQRLLPRVLNGELDLVLLSGNPGDGKTSLLVQLGDQLRRDGAEELSEPHDPAGWVLKHGGRTFHAVYDASEAHGELSSDDLVRSALDPVLLESEGPATALVAINDGRLHQFFEDHNHLYEDWWFQIQDQIAGQDPGNSRVVLIDLKRRSLAAPSGNGLASEALGALVRDDLWTECGSCLAEPRCPISANRKSLAAEGGSAFAELMLTSHLRRRRRATFRDVRSAAAWLITGDRDCTDVHDLVRQGRSVGLMTDALAHDLAFVTDSNDYLIDEWSDLDPALVPDPRVDLARRTSRSGGGPEFMQSVESASRAIFFDQLGETELDRSAVRGYRHFDEFVSMLTSESYAQATSRLLLGISRLVGAHGFSGTGLAFGVGTPESSWAILHSIDVAEFSIERAHAGHEYVETFADSLDLKHSSGARLTLTLDTAEMILRSADGAVINDSASDAIRQEIDAFIGQLSRHPSRSAHIIDSSGFVTDAVIKSGRIVLTAAGAKETI